MYSIRVVILNSAKDFYKNYKERLKEQARNKYRELSEEKKYKDRIWKKQTSYYVRRKKAKIKIISKRLSRE